MKYFGVLALASLGVFAHGTILTFDLASTTGTANLDQGYGDAVTAATMGDFIYDISNGVTPDVNVAYENTNGNLVDLTRWANNYNDLVNVIEYEPDGAAGWQVRLTASNDQFVSLDGFDVGNWGGAIDVPEISVEDGNGNVLFSETDVSLAGSTAGPHVSFDFSAPLVAEELLIKVNTAGLGGSSDNVGMDNISFTQQPVPEPFTLVGLGALALLARRKKK